MNPMAEEAIKSIVRAGLMFLAGYLVHAGIWTEADATKYVSAASLGIISIAWSQRAWFLSRLKLMTALTMPPGTTEDDVTQKIKSGAPIPTVKTPPNTVPGVPDLPPT